MIITKTPYRISFFGGGTDYPAWFKENEGLVIGSTFARYCYITCRLLPPFFDHKTRVVYSIIESVKEHGDINHPAVRACLQYLKFSNGLEIHHDGDLPARSGLGSSSSFTVGLLSALHGLRHEMPTKQRLSDEAIEIEQKILEENVGIQDQILAAHGGFNVIKMGPGDDHSVLPLVLAPSYRKSIQEHIMLGFTGKTRNSTDVAKNQIRSIQRGQSHIGEMCAMAKEALSLFQKQQDLEKIGTLMDKNWKVKRSIGGGISNSDIDDLYQTAIRHGAYGGKILGAGGGGFMMFFAPPERQAAIKEALPQLKVWVPFQFESEGSQVIFHTDVNQEKIEAGMA